MKRIFSIYWQTLFALLLFLCPQCTGQQIISVHPDRWDEINNLPPQVLLENARLNELRNLFNLFKQQGRNHDALLVLKEFYTSRECYQATLGKGTWVEIIDQSPWSFYIDPNDLFQKARIDFASELRIQVKNCIKIYWENCNSEYFGRFSFSCQNDVNFKCIFSLDQGHIGKIIQKRLLKEILVLWTKFLNSFNEPIPEI